MRRGAWHQFGHSSQRISLEQLQLGVGQGVIVSARDLSLENAIVYAREYHHEGAEILFDHQFYVPVYSNAHLASYPTNNFRNSISGLHQIATEQIGGLTRALETIQRSVGADAVIAPAVVYEAGRTEIDELNSRLFDCAKSVGDLIGVPTYATVVLGRSATASQATINHAMAHATSLSADGWYFGYEFTAGRIPSSEDEVLRCCAAGLNLACTGKPVLHAYAGPLGLLSLGFGSTGVGIGHSQNLWNFNRERWNPTTPSGGSADAPSRFFSTSLWGTIVYPDEIVRLPAKLRERVITPSAYSAPVESSATLQWNRWEANKHFINLVCQVIDGMAAQKSPRDNAREALAILKAAVKLHQEIIKEKIGLKDETNTYQANWHTAMTKVLSTHSQDYDYLEMIS